MVDHLQDLRINLAPFRLFQLQVDDERLRVPPAQVHPLELLKLKPFPAPFSAMGAHRLSKIWITFRTYGYYRTGRTFRRWREREKVVRAVRFVREVLGESVWGIEIVGLDREGRARTYGDEERVPKKINLRGILITLRSPLEVTYTEEYTKIYYPINRFLMGLRMPLYNMWGYGDGSPWQMDGRHVHLDEAQRA
jgi:hypothetical protein